MKQKIGIFFYFAFLIGVFGRDFPSEKVTVFVTAFALMLVLGYVALRQSHSLRRNGGLLFTLLGLGILFTVAANAWSMLLLPFLLALYARQEGQLSGAALSILWLFLWGDLEVFEHRSFELVLLAVAGILVNPRRLRTYWPLIIAIGFYVILPGQLHADNLALISILCFFPGRPASLSAVTFTLPASFFYPDLWPFAIIAGLVLDQGFALFTKRRA
ncbi:MAG: hypothetical protein HS115_07455 [Spirochaetales bacterium]|nr:hypothetical protein [Spirochaetales bacterium]